MKQQALNPFLPLDEYIPDGEPRLFEGRLYLYGSHDEAGGTEFCMNDYVLYSAPADDLSDWRYEGVIYRREDDPVANGAALQAPDCVQGPDGRYYLYYNPTGVGHCGVAVSNTPAGPFRFLGHVAYPDGSFPDTRLFDPGVLVDDDGSVYLYTGFVPTPDSPLAFLPVKYSVGFRLAADMLTILEGPVELLPGAERALGTPFEGHGFYEASSPRKINGRYYLVYSSELTHDLCYATSTRPLGGYAYGGVLVSNADIGYNGNIQPVMPFGNTHGGLVQVGEKWYVFYHRQTHGIECCRQACAEEIQLDAQGRFAQVEITSCGLNGGPLAALGRYNACHACHLTSPAIKPQRLSIRECVRAQQPHIYEDGKAHYIANITDGTVAGYKYFAWRGPVDATLLLRAEGTGRVGFFTDAALTKKVGEAAFTPALDGWQTCAARLATPVAITPLYLRFATKSRVDFQEILFTEVEDA